MLFIILFDLSVSMYLILPDTKNGEGCGKMRFSLVSRLNVEQCKDKKCLTKR